MTESEAIKIINGIEEVRGELPEDGEDVEIALMMAKDALSEAERYRAIGTVEELRELKEKAEPKKIRGTRFVEAICPECETELFETYWAFGGIHYCSQCGTAIDWRRKEQNERDI